MPLASNGNEVAAFKSHFPGGGSVIILHHFLLDNAFPYISVTQGLPVEGFVL